MEQQNKKSQTRPELLKVLCILSFVGSGMSLLSYGVLYLTHDLWKEAFQQGVFDFVLKDEEQIETFELLVGLPASYFLLQTLLFSASFFGVYKMWKLKKVGFHIYTISQILLLISLQLFISNAPFPWFPAMLTASFVFFYYRHLNLMT